jgi:hypothetical protein
MSSTAIWRRRECRVRGGGRDDRWSSSASALHGGGRRKVRSKMDARARGGAMGARNQGGTSPRWPIGLVTAEGLEVVGAGEVGVTMTGARALCWAEGRDGAMAGRQEHVQEGDDERNSLVKMTSGGRRIASGSN